VTELARCRHGCPPGYDQVRVRPRTVRGKATHSGSGRAGACTRGDRAA
jgi:hypothetical protein